MSALKVFLSFLLQELILKVFKPITRHQLTSLKNNVVSNAMKRPSRGARSKKIPEKCFMFAVFAFKFEKDTICLSVLEAKLTGL